MCIDQDVLCADADVDTLDVNVGVIGIETLAVESTLFRVRNDFGLALGLNGFGGKMFGRSSRCGCRCR